MTVLELITGKLLRRLQNTVPVLSGYDAVSEAVRLIGLELVRRESDLAHQDAVLTYGAGSRSAALPNGFAGLLDHPCLASGRPLIEATSLEMVITESAAADAQPRYYRQIGMNLEVYPSPQEALTVQVSCKIVPAPDMSDDLPWLGQFDNLICEAAVQLSVKGTTLLADPGFMIMIDQGISAVLVPRQTPLPSRRPIRFF